MKEMEILIEDIPAEGLEIEASDADPWLHEVVKDALGEAFREGDEAKVSLHIDRCEGNVNVQGEIDLSSHPACDRCLERYSFRETIPLHAVLAPLYENRRAQELAEKDEVELVKEDLEFQFYEGDRFDLAEVIREQIVLDEPMKHICSEECRGLCSKCGKNLNKTSCDCEQEKGGSTFSALKDFRVRTDTKH